MGDLRVISGPSGDQSGRVDSGSILSSFWTHSGPYLRNLINNSDIPFIRPWVGTLRLNMTKYGYWEGPGWVPV